MRNRTAVDAAANSRPVLKANAWTLTVSIAASAIFYLLGVDCLGAAHVARSRHYVARFTPTDSPAFCPNARIGPRNDCDSIWKRSRSRTAVLLERRLSVDSISLEKNRSDGTGPDENVRKDSLSLEYAAGLVKMKLGDLPRTSSTGNAENNSVQLCKKLAKGKFVDLTCSVEGETMLEDLFSLATPKDVLGTFNECDETDVTIGAITVLQSLLIMGMQVGVKGSPEYQTRMVSHLYNAENDNEANGKGRKFWSQVRDGSDNWMGAVENSRRLKHERDVAVGTKLLALLKRKRSTQGAFVLLTELGVWGKHEDLALLRSGFPTKFNDEEESAAKKAEQASKDVDSLLGLRRDLRRLKVYTIDNESTSEIDDGLSVEAFTGNDGSLRKRFWIHIADADRWAPRDSEIINAAQRRATSLYLPTGSFSMFPNSLAHGCMSLKANSVSCALSLGVELLPDGSVDPASITLVPSLIRVTYRLTYDDADEMLEEGIGYSEEWQLGAMLMAAKRRRAYRTQSGATDGVFPAQIPRGNMFVQKDPLCEDNITVSHKIDLSSISEGNDTSLAVDSSSPTTFKAPPASPSFLLVTELMILAGEAMAKWGMDCAKRTPGVVNGKSSMATHRLKLPFRSQMQPDFKGRRKELQYLRYLQSSNKAGGYCAAWYFRRFIKPAKVSEEALPHSGLGLDCYVQWTSPIRRYGDLQMHAAAKRYLRQNRIREMLEEGTPIPPQVTAVDLGGSFSVMKENATQNGALAAVFDHGEDENPIDYKEGLGLSKAARPLQRSSNQYWMFEYLNRRKRASGDELVFECVVLGCIDVERFQYAVYIHELGLEHSYLSEKGELSPGETLWLKVADAHPRRGLMKLSLASRSSGLATIGPPTHIN